MDTIYDAKPLWDDNAELLALLCRAAAAQDMAILELPKAAPLPASVLRQSSGADDPGYQPAGWGWVFAVPGAAGKSGRSSCSSPARDADADHSVWAGLGADDYLTKPFLMQELLLLRVQHILQQAYRAELSYKTGTFAAGGQLREPE